MNKAIRKYIAVVGVLVTTCAATRTDAQAATDPKIEYYLAKQDWKSLVKIGQSAVPRLVTALSDTDTSVRQGSVEALGQIGDRSAIEPLVAITKGDKDRMVRWMAAKALIKLGYSPESVDDKVFLCVARQEYNRDGKDMEELVGIGPKAVMPLCGLLRKLKANANYESAAIATEALGKIGNTNAVGTLIAVADGEDYVSSGYINVAPDYPLTCAAVLALGKIRAPETFDHLIKLMERSSNRVKNACALALGELGDDRAAVPLGKLFVGNYSGAEYDKDYRSTACDALVKLGVASVEPLIPALKHRQADVRRWASSALGEIGDKRAVEPLCELLNDKESSVRQAVVDALGQLKDQRAIEPLIGALKDSDSGVRGDAAKALDKLGWKP